MLRNWVAICISCLWGVLPLAHSFVIDRPHGAFFPKVGSQPCGPGFDDVDVPSQLRYRGTGIAYRCADNEEQICILTSEHAVFHSKNEGICHSAWHPDFVDPAINLDQFAEEVTGPEDLWELGKYSLTLDFPEAGTGIARLRFSEEDSAILIAAVRNSDQNTNPNWKSFPTAQEMFKTLSMQVEGSGSVNLVRFSTQGYPRNEAVDGAFELRDGRPYGIKPPIDFIPEGSSPDRPSSPRLHYRTYQHFLFPLVGEMFRVVGLYGQEGYSGGALLSQDGAEVYGLFTHHREFIVWGKPERDREEAGMRAEAGLKDGDMVLFAVPSVELLKTALRPVDYQPRFVSVLSSQRDYDQKRLTNFVGEKENPYWQHAWLGMGKKFTLSEATVLVPEAEASPDLPKKKKDGESGGGDTGGVGGGDTGGVNYEPKDGEIGGGDTGGVHYEPPQKNNGEIGGGGDGGGVGGGDGGGVGGGDGNGADRCYTLNEIEDKARAAGREGSESVARTSVMYVSSIEEEDLAGGFPTAAPGKNIESPGEEILQRWISDVFGRALVDGRRIRIPFFIESNKVSELFKFKGDDLSDEMKQFISESATQQRPRRLLQARCFNSMGEFFSLLASSEFIPFATLVDADGKSLALDKLAQLGRKIQTSAEAALLIVKNDSRDSIKRYNNRYPDKKVSVDSLVPIESFLNRVLGFAQILQIDGVAATLRAGFARKDLDYFVKQKEKGGMLGRVIDMWNVYGDPLRRELEYIATDIGKLSELLRENTVDQSKSKPHVR